MSSRRAWSDGAWLPLNFMRLVLEITPSMLLPCAITGKPFQVPLPFPGDAGVSGRQERQLAHIAAVDGQVLQLLHVDRGGDRVRTGFHQGRFALVHFDRFGGDSHLIVALRSVT